MRDLQAIGFCLTLNFVGRKLGHVGWKTALACYSKVLNLIHWEHKGLRVCSCLHVVWVALVECYLFGRH